MEKNVTLLDKNVAVDNKPVLTQLFDLAFSFTCFCFVFSLWQIKSL